MSNAEDLENTDFPEPDDEDGCLGDEATVVAPVSAQQPGELPPFAPTQAMPPLPRIMNGEPEVLPEEDDDGEPLEYEDAHAPRPGITATTTPQKLGREWARHHPDDRRVNVKLWHVVDGRGIVIGSWDNVMLSMASEPERWIRYRGEWMVEIREQDTRKHIATKRVWTEGADPPDAGWEPYFGSDDDMSDPRKIGQVVAEVMKQFGGGQAQQPLGGFNLGAVSTGVFNDQLGYLRYQLDEAQKKAERKDERIHALQSDLSKEQAARAGAEQRATGLKERVDSMQNEINMLRMQVQNGGNNKESPFIALMNMQSQTAERMAANDRAHSQQMMTMMMEAFKGRGGGGLDQISQGWSQLFEGAMKMSGGGKSEDGTTSALIGVLGQVLGPGIRDKFSNMLGAGGQKPPRPPQVNAPQPPAQRPPSLPAPEQPTESAEDNLQKQKATVFVATLGPILSMAHEGADPHEVGMELAMALKTIKRQEIHKYVDDAADFVKRLEEDPDGSIKDFADKLGIKSEDYIATLTASFKQYAGLSGAPKPEAPRTPTEAEKTPETPAQDASGPSLNGKREDVGPGKVANPARGTNKRRGNRGRPARKRNEGGENPDVASQPDQDVGNVSAKPE
jgi:hypothetical protein